MGAGWHHHRDLSGSGHEYAAGIRVKCNGEARSFKIKTVENNDCSGRTVGGKEARNDRFCGDDEGQRACTGAIGIDDADRTRGRSARNDSGDLSRRRHGEICRAGAIEANHGRSDEIRAIDYEPAADRRDSG